MICTKLKKTKVDFFSFICHFSILMFDMDFIKTVNLLNLSHVCYCVFLFPLTSLSFKVERKIM